MPPPATYSQPPQPGPARAQPPPVRTRPPRHPTSSARRRADHAWPGGRGAPQRADGLLRRPGERRGARNGHAAGPAHRAVGPGAHLPPLHPPCDPVMGMASIFTRLVSRDRRLSLAVAFALVLVAAGPLLAQAPGQEPVLDGIASQYRNAARLWRPRLIPVPQPLLLVLATL